MGVDCWNLYLSSIAFDFDGHGGVDGSARRIRGNFMPPSKKPDILISWSGGKDCALALYDLLQDGAYQPVSLLTTLTEDYDRISMHGIRRSLLLQQADSLGLPLIEVLIPKDATNEIYAAKMEAVSLEQKKAGVDAVMFGDIFLEDVRDYRVQNLSRVGMEAVFPLWGVDTAALAHRFIELGFKAALAVVDSQVLDGKFADRDYDEKLLDDLPAGIDPCGENGEFHTFVHAGPLFHFPISFTKGEVVLRDNRFYFCDFIEK